VKPPAAWTAESVIQADYRGDQHQRWPSAYWFDESRNIRPEDVPPFRWCGACRCLMPRDVWGRCTDCAALPRKHRKHHRRRACAALARFFPARTAS